MKRVLLILLFVLGWAYVEAQKVKYKDLFVFLSGGQYQEAEPLLRRYLKDNVDNPNAHMYMGYIYEQKFLAADVLKETNKVTLYGDSAVFFLELANKNMTEKEIKKNEEYYTSFNRTDRRTGDFGASLSDVVNHLSDKSKEVRERQQKVERLIRYWNLMVGINDRLIKFYASITAPYQDIRQLYLRSNDSLVMQLEELSERQDSLKLNFNSYKSVLTQMGKSNYNQTMELAGIKDFRVDGRENTDFYGEKLRFWDYNYWAQEVIKVIKTEIKPVLGKLVLIDADLTALKDRVVKDSVSVSKELNVIREGLEKSTLLNYDSNPLPFDILLTKMADIDYSSLRCEGKADLNSPDLTLKLKVLEKEAAALKWMDSISTRALARDIDTESINYQGFIRDTYGSVLVAKSFLRTTNDFARSEMDLLQGELTALRENLKWIIDGLDSIPTQVGVESKKFYPLYIQEESFTTGVTYRSDTSKVKGYFYTISKDRKPQVKVNFPLDHHAFHYSKRELMDGTVLTAVLGNVYFTVVWSEEQTNGQIPVVVSKIYTVDGLAWSFEYWLNGPPDDIKFETDKGELVITSAGPNGPSVVRIGKDGKKIL